MPDLYWRTDGTLYPTLPGIKIIEAQDIEESDRSGRLVRVIRSPRHFQTYTRDCLNWLYQTACGRTVLDEVAGANNCSIAFSQRNSAGVGNAQASMTQAAWEIVHLGVPGADARNSLRRCFTAYGARRAAMSFRRTMDRADESEWLAHVVNRQPRWLLDRTPGSDGGVGSYVQSWREAVNRWMLWSSDRTEGYFDRDLWLARAAPSASGIDVTPSEVQAWMNSGILPGRLSTEDQNQLKLAAVVALEEFSTPAAGSPSSIRFAIGAHDAFIEQRAPCIALGHELVHAYFSLRGRQPGEELSHFSTVLFEFKCVGLGPWKDDDPSENALRSQWPEVIHNPHNVLDAPNRRRPGRRIRY